MEDNPGESARKGEVLSKLTQLSGGHLLGAAVSAKKSRKVIGATVESPAGSRGCGRGCQKHAPWLCTVDNNSGPCLLDFQHRCDASVGRHFPTVERKQNAHLPQSTTLQRRPAQGRGLEKIRAAERQRGSNEFGTISPGSNSHSVSMKVHANSNVSTEETSESSTLSSAGNAWNG